METKRTIRKEKLALRQALPAEETLWKSRSICNQILHSQVYENARYILAYAAIRGEVDLSDLIQDAWNQGKHVFFPRVSGAKMEFYEAAGYEDLELGTFQVREPRAYCRRIPEQAYQQGIVLVPGVAFSKEGDRIGYGKGYYDRYLGRHQGLYSIGIAYELQLTRDWDTEPLDCQMNEIITEKPLF